MESPLDKVWKDKPEYIRKYYDLLPRYQCLCEEVQHIIQTKVKSPDVETGSLTSRAKTLPSFCEKIVRKSYDDPFKEITDFSGVRLVYLYLSDLSKIETVIEKEFKVIEKVNKVTDKDVEEFGYGALHYIVKLKKKHAGARYDDIKDLRCEIQVRTILQDSWAIVAHHLSYKSETDIPEELRRKLNALSGLFEMADDQFNNLRTARNEYQEKAKNEMSKDTDTSLDQPINLDNLIAYISWKLPDRELDDNESIATLLEELQAVGYVNISDIDKNINCAYDAVLAYEKDHPPTEENSDDITVFTGEGIIRTALRFVDLNYCNKIFSERALFDSKEYSHLIKKAA